MKVKFEAGYKEFAEVALLASGEKYSAKNILFGYLYLYGIVAALSSLPVLMFAPHYMFAVVNFVFVFLVSFYFYRPPNRNYFIEQYRSIYGDEIFEYEVELNENNLKVTRNQDESVFSWSGVKELIETDDCLFLIFKYQSGLKIPKQAFENPAMLGGFISFTKSHIPIPEKTLNG